MDFSYGKNPKRQCGFPSSCFFKQPPAVKQKPLIVEWLNFVTKVHDLCGLCDVVVVVLVVDNEQ
jgi:hypothetical protein